MAADTTRLITDAAKYQASNVNPKMQQALRVLAKLGLGNSGNITASDIKTFVQNALNLVGGMTPEQLRAASVNVWVHAAGTNITFPSTLSTQTDVAKYLAALSDGILDQVELYAEAKAVAAVMDP